MQSPEERPVAQGDRVDGYVIGPQIGKGATAWVFEATHEASGDRVAMKIMRLGVRGESSLRSRFERELSALADIESRHVPELYDIGELECGAPYMVMESLRGGTLHDRLCADEQLTTSFAVELTAQLAAALSAAHEAGVIHRDVKPSNIVLHEGPDDVLTLKLLDFGICMPIGEDEPKLTMPGKTVGTPDYMSPEQARGLPIDERSDVFSAGSVLYEMLTGRSPFGGRTAKAIARAVTRREPRPLKELRPDCPEPLVAVVERAMAKERDDRYPSADALRQALVDLAEELERYAPARGATLAMSAQPPQRPHLELHPELDDPELVAAPSRETDIIELPMRPPWQRVALAAVVILGMGWGALHVTGQGEALYDLATGETTGVPVNSIAVAEASDGERSQPRKTATVDSLDALARIAGGPVAMPDLELPSDEATPDDGLEASDDAETDAADEAEADAERERERARRWRARRAPPPSTTVLMSASPTSSSGSSNASDEDIEDATRRIEEAIRVPPPPSSAPSSEPAPSSDEPDPPSSPYRAPVEVTMPSNPY